MTKRDQDSEMSKAAKIVLDLALDRAWEPEQYAAIEKLRKADFSAGVAALEQAHRAQQHPTKSTRTRVPERVVRGG